MADERKLDRPYHFLRDGAERALPMDVLRTVVSAPLFTIEYDRNVTTNVSKAIRLPPRSPVGLTTIAFAKEAGGGPDLSLSRSNFLLMLTAPRLETANALLTSHSFHADHELNASTFAAVWLQRFPICLGRDLRHRHAQGAAARGRQRGCLQNPGTSTPPVPTPSVYQSDAGQKKKILASDTAFTTQIRATHLQRMSVTWSQPGGDPKWFNVAKIQTS
jgi:hypothetical protein